MNNHLPSASLMKILMGKLHPLFSEFIKAVIARKIKNNIC